MLLYGSVYHKSATIHYRTVEDKSFSVIIINLTSTTSIPIKCHSKYTYEVSTQKSEQLLFHGTQVNTRIEKSSEDTARTIKEDLKQNKWKYNLP